MYHLCKLFADRRQLVGVAGFELEAQCPELFGREGTFLGHHGGQDSLVALRLEGGVLLTDLVAATSLCEGV